MGERNFKKITEDDYFNKSEEFRYWLRKRYKLYFDELTSKEQREHFRKFIRKWNERELDEKYYDEANFKERDSASNTRYKWGFVKNINDSEMDRVKSSVNNETNKFPKKDDKYSKRDSHSRTEHSSSSKRDLIDEPKKDYKSSRSADKRLKKHHEMVMEELVPKPVGREAMLEKKKMANAYHKKEKSPEMEFRDSDLMGEADTFKSALLAEKKRNERRERVKAEREEEIQSKVAKYKAQEDESMKLFKELAKQRNNL